MSLLCILWPIQMNPRPKTLKEVAAQSASLAEFGLHLREHGKQLV